MRLISTLTLATLLAAPMFGHAATPASGANNIVLVHGAFADGSGWRVVHDVLRLKGYNVSIVQEALTSFDDDVAATRAVVDRQDGPVVLVGHSYGGAVITVAGDAANVKALVYVAAFEPDVGESVLQLVARTPALSTAVRATPDGRLGIDPAQFGADFAGDLPPNRTNFMAASQVTVNPAAFRAKVTVAAWRDKPSYAIVATEDRSLSPELQRQMYQRAGATVTEIKGSHAVYISQAEAVAAVIEQAALNAH